MSEGRIITGADVLPPMDTPGAGADPPKPKHPTGKAGKPPKRGDHRGTRDRFDVLNGFVDCSIAGLSRAELAAWFVLFRDTRNGTARTSAGDIGRRIGTSRRAVVTAINRLEKRGLLTVVYRGGLNKGPSRYRVHPLPRAP